MLNFEKFVKKVDFVRRLTLLSFGLAVSGIVGMGVITLANFYWIIEALFFVWTFLAVILAITFIADCLCDKINEWYFYKYQKV